MNDHTSDQQVLESFVDDHFDLNTVRWREGHTVADVSCPGPLHEHGDQNPSASVALGDEQRVIVFKCHVGCETTDVLTELGLTWADLDLPGRERPRPERPEPEQEVTLSDVVSAYTAFQGGDDLTMLYVVLAAVASHELPDDPLWPAVIGAPSSGKTEVINGILGLPDVHPVSKLSAAGLMSASGKRDRGPNATGGLLKLVGESGILAFKDFTTLLSDNPDSQTEVLAILREVYDGRVDRHAGSDGGQVQQWVGHVTAIIACTEALDDAHAVRATMGERFVMVRQGVDATDARRRSTARRAMRSPNEVRERRRALHVAIQHFLSGERVRRGDGQHELTEEVEERLADLATLVARARSGVLRDRYHREIESVPEPEFPARLAKQLAKLWRSLGVIGLTPEQSWSIVGQVCTDSMPLLRWKCLDALLAGTTTAEVVKHANRPKRTVLRALQDLKALQVIDQTGGHESGETGTWSVRDEYRKILARRGPLTEQVKSVPATCSYLFGSTTKKDIHNTPQGTTSQSAGTLSSRADQRKRRSGDLPSLRSLNGCTAEEWEAGMAIGYPDWTTFYDLGQWAGYCDECMDDRATYTPLVENGSIYSVNLETGEVTETVGQPGRWSYEPERLHRPQAVHAHEEGVTVYYLCEFAHGWASTFDTDTLEASA